MVSLDTVKKILQITTTKHDDYLNTMILLLEEYAKDKTNNDFLDENGNEVIPGAVTIFVAKACEYNMNKAGVTSRSMGEVSYSYDLDFPRSITKLLDPYRKVKFNV
jgi:hypothetical protein